MRQVNRRSGDRGSAIEMKLAAPRKTSLIGRACVWGGSSRSRCEDPVVDRLNGCPYTCGAGEAYISHAAAHKGTYLGRRHGIVCKYSRVWQKIGKDSVRLKIFDRKQDGRLTFNPVSNRCVEFVSTVKINAARSQVGG